MDLIPQSLCVQVDSRMVALSYMQGHVLGTEAVFHTSLGGLHELGGDATFTVGTEDSQGGDVAVGYCRILLPVGRVDIAQIDR